MRELIFNSLCFIIAVAVFDVFVRIAIAGRLY